jgi:hypothetical protein
VTGQARPYRTIYDVLDEWLGERFDVNSQARFNDLPADQLETLFDSYLANPPGLPNTNPDEWIPFRSRRPFRFETMLSVPLERRSMSGDRSVGGPFDLIRDDALRQLLLYAHGVFISVPLKQVLDPRTPDTRYSDFYGTNLNAISPLPPLPNTAISAGDRKLATGDLARRYYLRNLAQMRPLAEVGAIHWLDSSLPELQGISLRLPSHLHNEAAVVHQILGLGMDFNSLEVPLRGKFITLSGDEGAQRMHHVVKTTLDELVDSAGPALRGLGHLHFRHPLLADLFTAMMNAGILLGDNMLTSTRKVPSLAESQVSRQLMSLQLPNINHLDANSMVTIRANNETFLEWRNTLRRALTEVHAMGSADLDDAHFYLQETLTPEAMRVDRELRKSRITDRLTGSARSFSFGLIGASASLATGGNLTTSSVSAGVTGLSAAVVDWLASVKQRSKNKAVLAHYSALGVETKKSRPSQRFH